MQYEGLTAVFSGISATGVAIAVWQLHLQRRAWRAEHERARREKAIERLHEFSKSDCEWWAASRKLIERLDRDALKKLIDGDPFDIKSDLKDLLFAAIPTAFTEAERAAAKFPLTLTQRQVFALRWHAISFLNAVEIVFQAWRSDVADSEMIEAEMRAYYEPEKGRTLMRGLRDVADGKDGWPALHHFLEVVFPPTPKRPSIDEASK